jgi:beta-barrel assembly-enhancing protease
MAIALPPQGTIEWWPASRQTTLSHTQIRSGSLIMRSSSPRFQTVTLALGMTVAITLLQPIAAQAFNWRDLLPRILPTLIETVKMANISDAQELVLGQQIDRQMTTKQFKILNDRNLTAYVNQIGQRLATQVDRKNLTYTFQIVDDKSINAAATMGGYVYINKGLIDTAENEAQLASVIAHELGHIEGRHSIEQAKNAALAQTGAAALKLDTNQIANIGMQIGLNLPRSRRFELNADERGLRILTAAGYNGQAMVEFMKKLDKGGATAPKWLSSHPETQDRVKQLQRFSNQLTTNNPDGLDVVAYAQRVGKPIPTVIPVIKPAPIAVTPVVVTPKPAITPRSTDVVLPTDGFVVPTQPMGR